MSARGFDHHTFPGYIYGAGYGHKGSNSIKGQFGPINLVIDANAGNKWISDLIIKIYPSGYPGVGAPEESDKYLLIANADFVDGHLVTSFICPGDSGGPYLCLWETRKSNIRTSSRCRRWRFYLRKFI